MDARTKVTCLIDGIKTDLIESVKAKIMQGRGLRRDFERCVTFYKDLIKQSSGNQSNEARRVSEVCLYRKGNNDVEDRYYSKG